ncbi:TspO/MBR family protein [Nitzschia inconspicua]|uniref:TspO/MBR family protein n=1 Tax=Nitzschia inconspicua TaxID=303405 RepID=A0A9K3LHI6_9STRA|nr:TspO/MBR family protein [Nitzschia inconspicua]
MALFSLPIKSTESFSIGLFVPNRHTRQLSSQTLTNPDPVRRVPGLPMRKTYQWKRAPSPTLRAIPPSLWWILGHELLGSAPVPFIASATKNGGWLSKIERPDWNPPDWLFGPVWTFLYATMGLAASKIYYSTKPSNIKKPLMILWAVHFALNISWAPVFFSLQRFRPACIISCLMVMTLLVVIPLFYSVNPSAGILLLPYLAWITFATFLNKELCKLNPTVKGYNNGMFQAQIQKLQMDAAKYADSS